MFFRWFQNVPSVSVIGLKGVKSKVFLRWTQKVQMVMLQVFNDSNATLIKFTNVWLKEIKVY